MPSPLELTVIMPDCGEKLHAALVEDGDGYVIHAEDWVLHVPRTCRCEAWWKRYAPCT